jgi:glycosyltransferase involved in cell wall biosynthesis
MPPCSSVSVVIPVFNGERFIAEAMDSVLAQACASARVSQVIVVDNNSTDGTLSLVSDLIATRYGERVLATTETRPNAANARNAGVRLATAEWLAFLDADDLWLPEKLDRQMEAVRQHPEASLFFSLGEEFHSADLSSSARANAPCRPEPYPMLTPSSLLLKREVFERVGDLPSVPGGEFIAWYGWARELGFKHFTVPEVLVRRRIHATNTTRSGVSTAAYPLAAKWLLDKRRQAREAMGAIA